MGLVTPECVAESTIVLPEKCLDPSVPCFRFLDLHSSIFIGARPFYGETKIQDGFTGCIKNFKIDEKLIHFSEFDSFEKVGAILPGCRKFRPDLCSYSPNLCSSFSNNTASENVKCVDKWEGHICKCPFRVHSKNGCSNLGKIFF